MSDIDEIDDEEVVLSEEEEEDIDNDIDIDVDVVDDSDTCLMNLSTHGKINDNHFDIQEKIHIERDENGDIKSTDLGHFSSPAMTKYEITKVIGMRAQQIAEGSVPMIKVPNGMTDAIQIATLELRMKKIPYILKRTFSENHTEYWKLKDLECDLSTLEATLMF